ncbi:MAG: acyloxyacyl hydrolase [Burkholderiaceae bacterium]
MPGNRFHRKTLFIAYGTVGALAGSPVLAQGLQPSTAFVQASRSPATSGLVGGVAWPWQWQHRLGASVIVGYWEISLGRWRSDAGEAGHVQAWVSQFGATPVLRLQSADDALWFAEAGVGANLIAPLYRSQRQRFSTVFNFGEHIGVGRRFGAAGRHEFSLRLQHFSNGGLRDPNPGANFVALRYAWQFD